MSRFHRLEFDRASGPAKQQQPAEQLFLDGDALHEADTHRRNGRFEEALRYYSRALELDRSLVKGWLGQVQMLVALGEYPEAELWSRKALEMFRENGDLMAGRAHALCRMGKPQDAQALSDSSLAARDQSAYRWMVRGEIFLSRKEPMEKHCLDKAQQVDGDWLILLEIAAIYLHYGRLTNALARLKTVVEQAPNESYPWFLLGDVQAQLGMLRFARESYTRCLEIAPKHPGARKALEDLPTGNGRMARLKAWMFRR